MARYAPSKLLDGMPGPMAGQLTCTLVTKNEPRTRVSYVTLFFPWKSDLTQASVAVRAWSVASSWLLTCPLNTFCLGSALMDVLAKSSKMARESVVGL